MDKILYKYTTLESLALILRSKKIRLNPLTVMDDLQEAQSSDEIEYGINVNIKMYIFDHLRMYIFAILPLDRYIFSIDRIFP